MFAQIGLKLTRVPTPVAGLALGIASISSAIELIFPAQGMIQAAGALVALVLIALVLTKFIVFPEILYQDFMHSVTSSILPTAAMGLMVISKSLAQVAPIGGEVMWKTAVVLHGFFLLGFIFFRARKWDFRQMVPSWFVPPVGIAVAALTAPANMIAEATLLLYFAMACYTIMLPIMLYRFMFYPGIVDAAKPTIAIMGAPASLLLAGYLSILPEPNLVLAGVLLSVALLMTTTVYVAGFALLRLPFSPGYAAFTFPLAIGATALHKAAAHASLFPSLWKNMHFLHELAIMETIIAAIVITYVIIRYAAFYTQDYRKARRLAKLAKQTKQAAVQPAVATR